jgi:hypothetical protein
MAKKEKPTTAFILSLIGGIFILLGAILLLVVAILFLLRGLPEIEIMVPIGRLSELLGSILVISSI